MHDLSLSLVTNAIGFWFGILKTVAKVYPLK